MALKDEMPQTAAWVAELRAVFCETPEDLASFNQAIRDGMAGMATFYACENGRVVGKRDQRIGIIPALPTRAELEARKEAEDGAEPSRRKSK